MKPAPKNALTSRLALQIVDFAARNDFPLGHHLTEQAISAEFHVSRTPIRRAMQLLQDMGVLRAERNRGFFLAKTGRALKRSAPAAPPSDQESAYFRIAEDRLKGSLGEALREADLIRKYDVTRAQAQAILQRMSREGLISPRQGRGWAFQPLLDSADAHDESYRFRMIIEPSALSEPTFRVDPAEFDQLRREQQTMLDGGILRHSRSEIFEIGSRFHEVLVGWSGNRFLVDAIRRQNQLRRFIEYRARMDRSGLAQQCREHIRLLDMLGAGDLKAAADFLRRHLDVVRSLKTGVKPVHSAPAVRLRAHF